MRIATSALAALAVLGLFAVGEAQAGVASQCAVATMATQMIGHHGPGHFHRHHHAYRHHRHHRHHCPRAYRPMPGHLPMVVPFPGHPPVIHPPIHRYRHYYGYPSGFHYYGRGFGFSIGF